MLNWALEILRQLDREWAPAILRLMGRDWALGILRQLHRDSGRGSQSEDPGMCLRQWQYLQISMSVGPVISRMSNGLGRCHSKFLFALFDPGDIYTLKVLKYCLGGLFKSYHPNDAVEYHISYFRRFRL